MSRRCRDTPAVVAVRAVLAIPRQHNQGLPPPAVIAPLAADSNSISHTRSAITEISKTIGAFLVTLTLTLMPPSRLAKLWCASCPYHPHRNGTCGASVHILRLVDGLWSKHGRQRCRGGIEHSTKRFLNNGQRLNSPGNAVLHDPMVPEKQLDKARNSPFTDMQFVPFCAADSAGANPGVQISPSVHQNLGTRLAAVRRA